MNAEKKTIEHLQDRLVEATAEAKKDQKLRPVAESIRSALKKLVSVRNAR